MKSLTVIAALLLAFTSCKEEEMDTYDTTLRVNYYRQACQAVGESNCYLVQEGNEIGTSNWSLFYNEIEGFQYEAGFMYMLKARVEKVANPPADGASQKYTLLAVVSKEKR